jgi:Txe/YoeB family toxin of toxin-antitoxin system
LAISFYEAGRKKMFKNWCELGLSKQADKLLKILKSNPFQSYPTYEKLSGDLANYYSRRINIQHRLVYQVFPEKKIIKIIRMRSHYE